MAGSPFAAPGEYPGCGRRGIVPLFGCSVTMATTTPPTRGDLFPFELVRPELERVEISIREQVRGFDPAIEPYVAYVCNTSGKRIQRP